MLMKVLHRSSDISYATGLVFLALTPHFLTLTLETLPIGCHNLHSTAGETKDRV